MSDSAAKKGPSRAELARCFKALQLPGYAKEAEVRRAYRSLVLREHPDKGGDPVRFQVIQQAYDTLLRKVCNTREDAKIDAQARAEVMAHRVLGRACKRVESYHYVTIVGSFPALFSDYSLCMCSSQTLQMLHASYERSGGPEDEHHQHLSFTCYMS